MPAIITTRHTVATYIRTEGSARAYWSGRSKPAAVPPMPILDASKLDPTFTETSYTKLLTFPEGACSLLELRDKPSNTRTDAS